MPGEADSHFIGRGNQRIEDIAFHTGGNLQKIVARLLLLGHQPYGRGCCWRTVAAERRPSGVNHRAHELAPRDALAERYVAGIR